MHARAYAPFFSISHTNIHTHSYFEGSGSDSEEGGGIEGESEEAIRRRIAAEYRNEGLWSTTSSSAKDNEQGQGGGASKGDDDDDPLDAFMAGIEVFYYTLVHVAIWKGSSLQLYDVLLFL